MIDPITNNNFIMATISLLHLSARQPLRRLTHIPRYTSTPTRTFTRTALARLPRKNSQDKDSIDASPTEYSKSGTDADTAHKSSAFDPSTTDPAAEKKDAEVGSSIFSTLPLAPFFGEASADGSGVVALEKDAVVVVEQKKGEVDVEEKKKAANAYSLNEGKRT
jgi:hypothetical protein